MQPKRITVLDIETKPASNAELLRIAPRFDPPVHYKDPVKINAYCQEAFLKWADKAALDASTGTVCAIGMLTYEVDTPENITETLLFEDTHGGEAGMLDACFKQITDEDFLLTWNGYRFDMPFMYRRAWVNRLPVPFGRIVDGRLSKDPRHIDLMAAWCLGVSGEMAALNTVSRTLGVGQKSGSGAMFHKLYADPTTKVSAIQYLQNDLRLTLDVAKAMALDY